MPAPTHNWDPEDILRPRPAGFLGQAPSDIMIERHSIQNSEPFRYDLRNLSQAYTIVGMGLGVAVSVACFVIKPDIYTMIGAALLYLAVGVYYDRRFTRGSQP